MVEKIPAREARQGNRKLNVFYVLVVGLGLMAAAWFVMELVWT